MIDIDTITRLALESAGGLNSLREVVISLAMQGKLVDQDPSDESAAILLHRLREKNSHDGMPDKKTAKQLPDFTPLKESDHPYQLPSGWVWVKLSSVGEINPRNKLEDDSQVGFIPMSLIQDGYANKHSFQIKKWSEVKQGFTHFQEGDIGVAKITPCFENRKSCVFRNLPNGKGAGTTELHIYRDTCNVFDPEFLLLYFKTESFISIGKSKMTGTAGQQRIPKNYFAETPIPLPPLAEQKRITEKIAYLLHQCDELDGKCIVRSENLRLAHSASIKRLIESDNADDFASSWQFICNHFDVFYSAKENVEELKKAILTLAMKGKLVPQDNDNHETHKTKSIVQASMSKKVSGVTNRSFSAFDNGQGWDIPYKVPSSWQWHRLKDICSNWGQKKPVDKFTYIDVGSIDNAKRRIGNSVKVIEAHEAPSRARKLVKRGSVIFSTVRPYLLNLAIVCEDYTPEPIVSTAFAVLHPIEGVSNRYLYWYLQSPEFLKYLDDSMKGVAYPAISESDFYKGLIPIPPFDEQEQIVNEIEHLMEICNALSEKLEGAALKQSQVLESIVKQVTAL